MIHVAGWGKPSLPRLQSSRATEVSMADTQNQAAEAEATPTVDYYKDLAERATAHLDKDRVTRAQAAEYVKLLTSGDSGSPMADFLGGIEADQAIKFSKKQEATPTELRDSLRSAYSHLKPSHQWLKAVIATAVELQRDIDNEVEIPS
jgi:hypothetical protein